MAHATEISFKEFHRRLNTEEAYRAERFQLRFSNGFVYPQYACVEF